MKTQRMTQVAYAQHRGISQQAVSKAVHKGRIPVDPDGRILVEQADAILDAKRSRVRKTTTDSPAIPALSTPPDAMTYAEAERRKMAAEAQSKELKLARERSEVVAVAEAQLRWSAIVTECRTRFLALDGKLAQRLNLDGRAKAILRAEIRDALELLGKS